MNITEPKKTIVHVSGLKDLIKRLPNFRFITAGLGKLTFMNIYQDDKSISAEMKEDDSKTVCLTKKDAKKFKNLIRSLVEQPLTLSLEDNCIKITGEMIIYIKPLTKFKTGL